jgi:hypothetical protein
LPELIDKAIIYLRQKINIKGEIGLVTLPSYQIHCFWIVKGNQIYIIDSPWHENINCGELLSFQNFIDKLNELKPSQGIIFDKERER